MPKKPTPKLTAWSFSRLKDYEGCALRAKLKHIDRKKEPGSKAMDRGRYIDDLAEKYSTKQINKLPEELELFEDEFKGLRKIKRHLNPQVNFAVDKNWKPIDWFDADTWLRVKMDVWYDVLRESKRKIIDYKTGKIRPEHQEQLELYAVAGHVQAPPAIEVLETELWYLDQGEIREAKYTRKQAEGLKRKWTARPRKMLADRTFKATPGNACRWCFFGRAGLDKGGPGLCKF